MPARGADQMTQSGVLKELCRMDGAPLVSVQTAMSKALGFQP
jgi:uncharacterized protein GlcG (DUF336 family)